MRTVSDEIQYLENRKIALKKEILKYDSKITSLNEMQSKIPDLILDKGKYSAKSIKSEVNCLTIHNSYYSGLSIDLSITEKKYGIKVYSEVQFPILSFNRYKPSVYNQKPNIAYGFALVLDYESVMDPTWKRKKFFIKRITSAILRFIDDNKLQLDPKSYNYDKLSALLMIK